MPKAKIFRDKNGNTNIHIPAFVRDTFNMQSGEYADLVIDGDKIIVTPPKRV